MKKLIVALLLILVVLLVAPIVVAQQVDSSQIKKKTDGGIVGDTASALAVGIVRATSAPSSPVTGQLWCDTTTTPCALKMYTGSTWASPLGGVTIPTQTDTTSFPSTPSDGQIFLSKKPYAIYVYDETAGVWVTVVSNLQHSDANLRDVYNSELMSAPGAPTVAASATAGSLSAGAYNYKITCRNGTGGETDGGTVSSNVSPGSSKSTDLSSIPTCTGVTGSGTITRGVYRTKANVTTGPWYWAATIADNTTTTLNDGVADSALVQYAPDINFSGAMPTGWTAVNNSTATTSGGCGVTARNTLVCMSSNSLSGTTCNSSPTSDPWVQGMRDISAYMSGDFTLEYRVKQVSIDGDSYLGVFSPAIGGLRHGTAANGARVTIAVGMSSGALGCLQTGGTTLPFTSSNHPVYTSSERTTDGGAGNAVNSLLMNGFPQVDALPIWFRWVRRGGRLSAYTSADGVLWSNMSTCNGTNNNTNTVCSFSISTSSMTYFELPLTRHQYLTTNQTQMWLEIDNWSLTVN